MKELLNELRELHENIGIERKRIESEPQTPVNIARAKELIRCELAIGQILLNHVKIKKND